MKERVKTDSALLSLAIIFTGFLYYFPQLYPMDRFWDNCWDFVGLMTVLKGTYIRMIARGYKKAHSQQGGDLVTGGIYSLVRNPMYLGSFLMGCGFVLIVWPWWMLPVFGLLFYTRFRRQVVKEEEYLLKTFGERYQEYCRKVGRVFPNFSTIRSMKLSTVIDLPQAFSTKEKLGLIGWPVLAIVLETMQEMIVFGSTNIERTVTIFFTAIITYIILEYIKYQVWN